MLKNDEVDYCTKCTAKPVVKEHMCEECYTEHCQWLRGCPHQSKTTINGSRCMRVKHDRLHMDYPVTRSSAVCNTGRLTCDSGTNL